MPNEPLGFYSLLSNYQNILPEHLGIQGTSDVADSSVPLHMEI